MTRCAVQYTVAASFACSDTPWYNVQQLSPSHIGVKATLDTESNMRTIVLLLLWTLRFVNGKEDSVYVGGWGNWTYFYMPTLLRVAASSSNIEHAHGIYIDDFRNIIVTYKDKDDPSKCLLKWSVEKYHEMPVFLGPGRSLCDGVPHGLASHEDHEQVFLYHANNAQVIHKTRIDGSILWSTVGAPVTNNTDTYSPTWLAAPQKSPFLYLADGYGSNRIYVFYQSNGTYTGHSFGGAGTEHGKFQTCHSIYWDERVRKMAVCDRENNRLEYFDIDRREPSVFLYSHTQSFVPYLQRLCNIRINHNNGFGILASLEGTVGIVTEQNKLLSVVNITKYLGDQGFLHPHDAHFLPNGDFVLVTWNPGRIGYFRRATNDEQQLRERVDSRIQI